MISMSKITFVVPTPYHFNVVVSKKEFVDLYNNCLSTGKNVHILVSKSSYYAGLYPFTPKPTDNYVEVYNIRQIYSHFSKLQKFNKYV